MQKTSRVGLEENGRSTAMLKRTRGLPCLGGKAVGTCCTAKGFRRLTWTVSCLSPIWSFKKWGLREMTVNGPLYSGARGVLWHHGGLAHSPPSVAHLGLLLVALLLLMCCGAC